MSHHRVQWDSDSELLTLVCEAPEDARCQWEPECDCEVYTGLEQAPDGTWSHHAYDWNLLATLEEDVRHQHSRKAHECHYMVWWVEYELGREAGPEAARWYYDENDQPVPPPEGPIVFTWGGDYYEWDYEGLTEPTSV